MSASPRIPPAEFEALPEETRSILRACQPEGRPANVFLTLARHPSLFRQFARFGGAVMNGRLPRRAVELAVMRVAWLCRSDYEWVHHVPIAADHGLDDATVDAIRVGADDERLTGPDQAIVAAVDELHETARVSDATWSALRDSFDEEQLIELLLLVGHFHGVAFLTNVARTEIEEPFGTDPGNRPSEA